MMGCADVEALAAELALGLVAGPARAEALAHIETCAACRSLVDSLSATADELVLLAPSAEPPSGFEDKVLAAVSAVRPIDRARSERQRRRWPPVAAVAAAVVALVVIGGIAVTRSPASVHEADMRTASGRVVGDAYLHGGDPAWVFVAVPGWTEARGNGVAKRYEVRLTLHDGSTRLLPGGDLDGGNGAWGTVVPVDPGQIREVALVDDDGTVWCSATF